jgi:hypothetical protein
MSKTFGIIFLFFAVVFKFSSAAAVFTTAVLIVLAFLGLAEWSLVLIAAIVAAIAAVFHFITYLAGMILLEL